MEALEAEPTPPSLEKVVLPETALPLEASPDGADALAVVAFGTTHDLPAGTNDKEPSHVPTALNPHPAAHNATVDVIAILQALLDAAPDARLPLPTAGTVIVAHAAATLATMLTTAPTASQIATPVPAIKKGVKATRVFVPKPQNTMK